MHMVIHMYAITTKLININLFIYFEVFDKKHLKIKKNRKIKQRVKIFFYEVRSPKK